MSKLRYILMGIGSLLIGMGLVVSVQAIVASARASLEPTATVSPFDQGDDIISPDQGFAPLIAPTALAETEQAPTSQPHSTLLEPTGQELAASVLAKTGTPPPVFNPVRLVIPAIHLDAPVVSAQLRLIKYQGRVYPQWMAPDSFSVGWSPGSAPLGAGSNTVLFGHHNEYGEVFGHLVDLDVNDVIRLYSGKKEFNYVIALKMILRERDQPVDVRLQNAQWILPSRDERLTLLTCWPYTSNTHRLIIVAVPITPENLNNYKLTPKLESPTP